MTDTEDPFGQPSEGRHAPEDELIRNGRYHLPDPDGGTRMRYFTRVTNHAKHISDTYRLSLWQQRMAVKGVCEDDGLRAQASGLDVTDDRKAFDALVEQAKTRADRKGRANLGSAVHRFTEKVDEGSLTVEQVPSTWRPDVVAYVETMYRHGLVVASYAGPNDEHRLMSEVTVYEPTFQIVGTLDRIVRVTQRLVARMMDGRRIVLEPGDLVVFDLKTGARALEFGGQEHAIQFSAYANATKMFDNKAWTWSDMPEGIRTDVGLVGHLPIGEHRMTVAGVDIEAGRQASFLVQQVKAWQRRKDLLAPVLTVETEEASA